MSIKETLDVINAMERDGVIGRYAIAGAVAAYNYIEPTLTDDLDILIPFEPNAGSGLISLSSIFDYLKAKGFTELEHEGVRIAGWRVQFLPVADGLDAEALKSAEVTEIDVGAGREPVATRILRPEYLVAICLRVGRPKDLVRISQFVGENAVDAARLCDVLGRHQLTVAWQAFCQRFGIPNPCK